MTFIEPLDGLFHPLEEGQIRLLQLQPGTSASPLNCQLGTVSLKDRPPFNALSYVWGAPENTETITLNGVSVRVTKNLHVALQYLRHESETTTLWVDALCICQADNVEKGKQVTMMGDIYGVAKLTWIWLGEASQEDDAVMEYLCANDKRRDPAELPIGALQYFFGRPWFRRLWVLQEALLSPQPIAKNGDKETSFERVVQLSTDLILKNLGNGRGDPFVNCRLRHCLHEWDRLKHILSGRGGWGLDYAMPMTEQLECTLLEDRVYALLGLSTESDRRFIKPDYARPLAETQTRTCAHLISSPENPLAALHYMGIRGNSDSDLPSWARDWSQPKGVDWHFWRKTDSAQERWHFLPKTEAGISQDWLQVEDKELGWQMEGKAESDVARFSNDLRILALRGISVDTVDSVHRAALLDEGRTSWKKKCESWKTLAADKAKAYPDREARFDAFCKTLCFGRYRDAQGNSSTHCSEAYEAWIRSDDSTDGVGRTMSDFEFRTERYGLGRAFIITTRGWVGMAPEHTDRGDVVCFFRGSLDPFILRPKGGMYQEFIGETLITGMMDGEWVEGADLRNITEFWIR